MLFNKNTLTSIMVKIDLNSKDSEKRYLLGIGVICLLLFPFFISTIFPDISDDSVNVEVGIIFPVADTVFLMLPFSILIYSYEVVEISLLFKL